jgi:cytochrome b561
MVSGYNRLQSSIHWLTAILIIFLIITGTFILSETPNSAPDKLGKLTIHAFVGMAALLLTIFRILWAMSSTQPVPVNSGNPVADKIGAMAPKVLNILALIVAGSGMAMGVGSGLMELIFAGTGSLPDSFSGSPVRAVHGLTSKLLLAAILFHVLAALVHQFVKKDNIMARISPFRSD